MDTTTTDTPTPLPTPDEMDRRIAHMTYAATQAYFRDLHADGFVPWDELDQEHQNKMTQGVKERLRCLCAGRRMASAGARDHRAEHFSPGIATYIIDMIVTAVYDYTMARARANATLSGEGSEDERFLILMGSTPDPQGEL